ncbi:unnamed protein product [Chironomus riparius]|uniref:Cytochrome b5 heme-binding domain-containing protein n=1 Tax=Chironomus riparius TaxID=315576 RepID=A0A9P0NAC0_9DIPT|nr:unnamed protein product [Chironomus riparius]
MKDTQKINDISTKLVVKYGDNKYDLTKFIRIHPGGENILKYKNNKNIDLEFDNSNHSEAAKNLLKEYKLETEVERDEGIENLVDWNKAMLPQISKLGDNYEKWVNSPVDRDLRLFKSDFLELITKSTWYMPLLFWIPIIIYIIKNELALQETNQVFFKVFTQLIIGIFLWTLFEYVLHQFCFHIDVRRFPDLKTFHFFIHGNHHKVPFDKYRLVFPPIPAAVIASLVFYILQFLHYPKLSFAGNLIGYLCYDMTHYYIHFASPTSNYFYNLKRHHNDHHFRHHDKAFGISNTFWDNIFSTKVLLSRLKYRIQWQK